MRGLRWPWQAGGRHTYVPQAHVRAVGPDGRALPLSYRRLSRRATHTWLVTVHVPLSRQDQAVTVDVTSPRTAVLIMTERRI